MAEKCVTYTTASKLNCSPCSLPAPAILCIPSELTAIGNGFIEATLKNITQEATQCGALYKYLFEYESDDLIPDVDLRNQDINGAFCQDCYYTALSEACCDPVTLSSNDEFTQLTLTDQYGQSSLIPISGAGITVGTLDSEPKDADGVTIDSGVLYLQTADASFPGLITEAAQTIGGAKTFADPVVLPAGNIVTSYIADNNVTLGKFQQVVTDSLLGRDTAGTGNIEVVGVTGGIEFDGTGNLRRSALTGDVTASAGSNATSLNLPETSYTSVTVTPSAGTWTPSSQTGIYWDIGPLRFLILTITGALSVSGANSLDITANPAFSGVNAPIAVFNADASVIGVPTQSQTLIALGFNANTIVLRSNHANPSFPSGVTYTIYVTGFYKRA